MAIRFSFIYPNGEEVQASVEEGATIFDAATDLGIQMDTKIKRTCIVKIESRNSRDSGFAETHIHPPTNEELQELDSKQIAERFRYAHSYTIDESLNDSLVFLNLIKVFYKTQKGQTHVLHALPTESFMALRDRKREVIDLAFACHGALACSTCHCVVDVSQEVFDSLGPISNAEEDLMQFANPEDHSRLGCQIKFRPDLSGIKIRHHRAAK